MGMKHQKLNSLTGEQGACEKGRANGQPLLGLLLPELELLPSPNSKRGDANVLLRSWWRPEWIWLKAVVKDRGEATHRIEYLLVKYLHVVYWENNDGSFMRQIIKISLAIDT